MDTLKAIALVLIAVLFMRVGVALAWASTSETSARVRVSNRSMDRGIEGHAVRPTSA